jgi:hypothetical protein
MGVAPLTDPAVILAAAPVVMSALKAVPKNATKRAAMLPVARAPRAKAKAAMDVVPSVAHAAAKLVENEAILAAVPVVMAATKAVARAMDPNKVAPAAVATSPAVK